MAASGAGITHAFFDYDSTITRPVFVARVQKWAISDKPDVCALLSPEELLEQFGGARRIEDLKAFFKLLTVERKIECHIVSHGRQRAIRAQLAAVDLLDFFTTIVASDMPALKAVRQDKGAYIARVLAEAGAEGHNAVFADDSERNLAAAEGVCRVYAVRGRHLTTDDLRVLGGMCAPPRGDC